MFITRRYIISRLHYATTQHLVDTYNEPIEEIIDYYEFIATKMLRIQFRISTGQAFDLMQGVTKMNNFALMYMSCYETYPRLSQ